MLYLLCGIYKIQSFFRCNKFHKLFSLVLSKYDDTQTAISLWYSRVIFSLPATLFISILQNIIEKLRKKYTKLKLFCCSTWLHIIDNEHCNIFFLLLIFHILFCRFCNFSLFAFKLLLVNILPWTIIEFNFFVNIFFLLFIFYRRKQIVLLEICVPLVAE